MSSHLFTTTKHTIPASYPREFPGGSQTLSSEPALQLVLNQYTPHSFTPCSAHTDNPLTIIFAHANGFHKEMYEPFFDDLLVYLERQGVKVRAIWAIDAATHGESAKVNDWILGDHPSWNDYARDIQHTITHFAAQMPEPRLGMGHSMGAQAIFQSALYSPRLYNAIFALDPVIEPDVPDTFPPFAAIATSKRRDCWPSREEAEKFFRSKPFYQAWDPRVLELHLKYGLTDLPTATYPTGKGVTLTTTKYREVHTYAHPKPGSPTETYRPETNQTFEDLPRLQVPRIFYAFGEKSSICQADSRAEKQRRNPRAVCGVLEGGSHFICFEMPGELAKMVGGWALETETWRTNEISVLEKSSSLGRCSTSLIQEHWKDH
ncbi:alpha/beta-hydrolase [Ascobolus immersus RN42]|uniref:Alpha/beta-hydrolase n=1 Tax=Ascobolus immersus RN42 TaxID=1160509 RepID=A0A3N4H9C4_ASCIM|nr:alpha/beta-hydrolase [Ascobolus immersus RN42]